jgi:predicted DNA binding protein
MYHELMCAEATMTIRVTITVPPDDFVLGRVVTEETDVRIQLNRVVPLADRIVPYLWVASADLEHTEEILGSDPEIQSFEVIEQVDGEELVRLEWEPAADEVIEAIVTSQGVLTEAILIDGDWSLHMRFPDRDHLRDWYDECIEREIDIEIESVRNPGVVPPNELGLTDEQEDILRVAHENGYFEIPREIELDELAAEFDISEAAASERIVRALSTVVEDRLEGRRY